jgi:hypothetical protein
MRTDRDPFVTMMFIIALALTAPRVGAGQGPTVRPDSTAPAPAVAGDDAWYPEGPVRIRGKRYSLFVGVTYTWFMNVDSRARFGQGTWSPSFELYRPQRRGLSPLLEVNDTRVAASDSMARVFAVSAGIRYRPVDVASSRWLALSVGLAAGPRVVRISGLERTTVFGIHAQLGVEILRTARVTVRYDALPMVHRTRLSAMSLGTAIRLPPYGKGRPRSEPRDTSVVATCAGARCAR